jgi:nitrogen fixation protein FixH
VKHGQLWPWFPVALLVLGVGANLVLLTVAAGDPSFAVERDYYRKAVEWDRTLAQGEENARLRWSLGCEVRGGAMTVRLRDAAGRPLPGASVTVEAFHNARSSRILERSLVPGGEGEGKGEGVYRADLPMTRPGLWELRFRAVRDGATFTRTLTYDLQEAR